MSKSKRPALNEWQKQLIVEHVASRTRTFGGQRKPSGFNPLENILEGRPAQFALGVDVAEVVDLVVEAVDILDATNGHVWHEWNGLTCCKVCGIVRRRDGRNSRCKGPAKVGPRGNA